MYHLCILLDYVFHDIGLLNKHCLFPVNYTSEFLQKYIKIESNRPAEKPCNTWCHLGYEAKIMDALVPVNSKRSKCSVVDDQYTRFAVISKKTILKGCRSHLFASC